MEERKRRRQEAIAKGETVPDEFATDKPPNIFPPDADIRPATEEEIKAAQKLEIAPTLKPLKRIKQKDGTIVERPSDEDLREMGKIEPGIDVL